jgi:pimeloyl-ACP methyl ester carboxylesterase
MNKIFIKILKAAFLLVVIIFLLIFFFQEKLIFFPEKLDKNYRFNFLSKFEEINIKTSDNKLLNGLLFTVDNPKGLIFYLHGNAGSLNSWGEVAKTYVDLHYDVFILDYRGYGKSEGSIGSQNQIFQDVQLAYNEMKKRYTEEHIVILGYSIGTGPSARLASTNSPRLLILQAPYYSMVDLMKYNFPVIPTFILKYKFETDQYLKDCKMPIVIFHGNADEVIYYGSSIKLKKLFKSSDTLITLNGQGHNGITDNPEYIQEIKKILN